MEFVNCTPHDVIIECMDGERITLPKGDIIPRVSTENVLTQIITVDGHRVKIYRAVDGKPVNMPPEVNGVMYIVSQLVVMSCPERHDLFYPNELIRNEDGEIVGCCSLAFKRMKNS